MNLTQQCYILNRPQTKEKKWKCEEGDASGGLDLFEI